MMLCRKKSRMNYTTKVILQMFRRLVLSCGSSNQWGRRNRRSIMNKRGRSVMMRKAVGGNTVCCGRRRNL